MDSGLRCQLDAGEAIAVLRLDGALSVRSAAEARRALLKALSNHDRLVVDLSRLRLDHPSCLQLFPAVLAGAGGWPRVRLALAAASPPVAAALGAARVPRCVPLHQSVVAAVGAIDARPPCVRAQRELRPEPAAAKQARTLVRGCCHDWEVVDTVSVELVANELVSNAVEHAESASRLTVELRGQWLGVRVRDWSREVARLQPADPSSRRGRGLLLVAALSENWGVWPRTDGKTVWAAWRSPPGGQAPAARWARA